MTSTWQPIPFYSEGDLCDCGAPIVEVRRTIGGEPGLTQAELDRGDAIAMYCAPGSIKRIELKCTNGHVFDVDRTEYSHDARRFTFEGRHRRLPDDFEGLTDPGWPRPHYRLRFQPKVGNYIDRVVPVPWVTPVPDFVTLESGRRAQAFDQGLCQICGIAHEPGSEVIVFLNGGLRARPEDERMDLENYRNVILRAIDDAVMHPRCAKLTAGVCPKLKRMRAEGDLWAFAASREAMNTYEDDEGEYLAMTGREARIYTL